MKRTIHGKFQKLNKNFLVITKSRTLKIIPVDLIEEIETYLYSNSKRLDLKKPIDKMLINKKIKVYLRGD